MAWTLHFTERLSTTAYAVDDDDESQRRYERVISGLLPYRAEKPKGNAAAQQFNEVYSTPFEEYEFIAVRDDPKGPFYLAEIMEVSAKSITVQYYGTVVNTSSRRRREGVQAHQYTQDTGTQ